MKVKKLQFNDHKVLKNVEVDFTNEHGEPLEIVVFIGDNGTGKTQLLSSIISSIGCGLTSDEFKAIESGVEITREELNVSLIVDIDGCKSNLDMVEWARAAERAYKKKSSIIWMPSELNIEGNAKYNEGMQSNGFIEYANQWSLDDVGNYIVKIIDEAVYANRDKPPREAIEDMAKMINDIFKILNLDFELIGVATDDAKTPKFRNSFSGEEFDINSLSTGEKQLFLRILSLRRLKVSDAIIIIDEPETSLHPEWQRKIVEVYKKVGENNQLIFATHSPFIVGSVPSESIRIMFKDEGEIKVLQQDENDKSYGKSVEDILKVTMDLDSLRNEEITKKFNKILELLEDDPHGTSEYDMLMNELKTQLGTADKDIMRIEMAKSIRMRQNAKSKQGN